MPSPRLSWVLLDWLVSRVLLDSLVDAVDLIVAFLQELLRASDVLRQLLQVVHETRLADVVSHVLDVLRSERQTERETLVTNLNVNLCENGQS